VAALLMPLRSTTANTCTTRLSDFFDTVARSDAGGVLVVGAMMACIACAVDGCDEQRADEQHGASGQFGVRGLANSISTTTCVRIPYGYFEIRAGQHLSFSISFPTSISGFPFYSHLTHLFLIYLAFHPPTPLLFPSAPACSCSLSLSPTAADPPLLSAPA